MRQWILLLCIAFFCPQFAGAGDAIEEEQTEFFRSVVRGDLERVRAQIAAGMDLNFSIEGMTPLMVAKSPEVIKLLVKGGADVNGSSDLLGQTALTFAVNQDRPEIVRALIEAGADLDARVNQSGMTALASAVFAKKSDMAALLIKAGADPNHGMVLGMPLISYAAFVGDTRLIKVLIEGGADINARNEMGATPLMVAISAHKNEVAKLLIEAGANVNARSLPPKGKRKRGRGGKSGHTAMDVAKETGDKKMEEMLEKTGAKESDKPPAPDYNNPNPSGMYTLPCGISGSPPPQGEKFSCSTIDQIADSGVERLTISSALFAGKHVVPRKKGCQVDLGQPGFYTIRTTTTSTPWELVCRARLGTTTGGENWIAFIRKGQSVIKTSENKVVVKEPEKKAPKEEKEPPKIKIVKPLDNDQFVFNKDEPKGVLEIKAEAEVTGDCDEAATWKVEDIGESKKKFDPEGASDNVTIKFEGLPTSNAHFGKKKITARACGKSDLVTVEIFFPPMAKNHPGKGSGETPNWFYYWQQIKKIVGRRPISRLRYQSEIDAVGTPGAKDGGIYSFFSDTVTMSDLIVTPTGCNKRKSTGVRATGIDCFAEDIWHEFTHRAEMHRWWGTYLNLILARLGLGEATERDDDRDNVPSWVEKNTPGCSDKKKFSCNRRAFNNVPDSEMNSYWEGWKWKIGDADKEDWSMCGKQWNDVSVCPENKQW